MAISNGVQCPQLNSGLGTSHGWLSSMWIERSDTLIHALGYNTTLFAGQSEGWYVLILVPKKLEDLETFNAVLQRGARDRCCLHERDRLQDDRNDFDLSCRMRRRLPLLALQLRVDAQKTCKLFLSQWIQLFTLASSK